MWNRLFRYLGLFWLIIVSLQASTGVVVAQTSSNSDIDNRLKRLELEIRDLHLHLFSEQKLTNGRKKYIVNKKALPNEQSKQLAPASDSAANTIVKLQNLEALVRSLQGVAEELNNRLDNLISDLDSRLASLEAKKLNRNDPKGLVNRSTKKDLGIPNRAIKPGVLGYIDRDDFSKKKSQESGDLNNTDKLVTKNRRTLSSIQVGSSERQNRFLPEGDAKVQYQHAFGYLRKREFQKAELALKEFLNANPNDQLVPNAMYWLGETYYTQGKYEDAAEIFISGYERHSGSSKTPDNLLKLGLSLLKLDRREDACLAFAQLLSEFPNGTQNLIRRASSESKRLGCAT